jgi:hypothetical protein
VTATTESTGKLDFPTLIPHGSAVKLISSRGAKAEYVAARTGTALLVARSRYCERPVLGSCVAFIVAVS